VSPPPLAPRPARRVRPLSLTTNLNPSMLSRIPTNEREGLIAPLEPDPPTPTNARHWRPAPPPPILPIQDPANSTSPTTPVASSWRPPDADAQPMRRPFRPLPIPPSDPSGIHRVDAFTLMRGVSLPHQSPALASQETSERLPSPSRPRPPSASSSFEATGAENHEGPVNAPVDGSDEFVYTDLDLLLARLEEAENGSNYDVSADTPPILAFL
ncbi:hypothetical protein P7C70_g3559, partial [Phenoliferia sp. Uapishka_3]